MIEHYSFGKITIKNKTYTQDLKIINGKIISGWWRKSGHLVEQDDVADIISAKPSMVVMGTGANGLMQVDESLRVYLAKIDIQLIAEPSQKAVEIFNQVFKEGRDVAAAFHLTC